MGSDKRKKRRLAERVQDAVARAAAEKLVAQSGTPQLSAQIFAAWQGPLPPPGWLEKYEALQPGLANRIFACFEKQVDHRIEIETIVVKGNTTAQLRGQMFALIVALAVLVFAWLLVKAGYVGWGIGAVLADLAVLAGVFVYGRLQQRRERQQKIEGVQN